MADDTGNEDAPPPSNAPQDPLPSRRRALTLGLAFLLPCGVIALSIFFMMRADARRREARDPSAVEPPLSVQRPATPLAGSAAGMASAAPRAEVELPSPVFDEEGNDERPRPGKRAAPKHFATVHQAALGSCSTESVDGLSRQIIAQARCIEPKAFVPLPKRPNLVLGKQVFPYLEHSARKHLLRALDAHPKVTMTINSALRTVAQQYLVWRWAASKTCGVQLATPPGGSNHEIGVALDIAEGVKWRSALEAEEFSWLGSSDRVHFDFKGRNAPARRATDVLAFQQLWNRNHRADPIAENGEYGPATEERLKKAPSDGFPLGPNCKKTARTPR